MVEEVMEELKKEIKEEGDNLKDLREKALSMVVFGQNCLKQIAEKNIPPEIFVEQDIDKKIINELLLWYRKYKSEPVMSAILDIVDNDRVKVKNRMTELFKIQINKNELMLVIDKLMLVWSRKRIESSLIEELDSSKYKSLEDYKKNLIKLGSKIHTVINKLSDNTYGGESFTTKNVEENIGFIKDRDTSFLKRFHLGHDPIDSATGGFLPGEVLMIVGNVNQGKSMVLANAAYHMWYYNNANVLILTAEMQPEMFDDRIYSRASAVEYSHIINGKASLSEGDRQALDSAVKEIKTKKNQIIVKWLNNSDNVNTVARYIEDLEKLHNFIPDVLIIDSLECLTPAKESHGSDWEDKGQIVVEFKNYAETFNNGSKLFVISTHQAKTVTQEKEFKDIDITDIGRSKIVAEKADAAIYLRCREDLKRMDVKTIKARRFSKDLSWSMAYDFSRVLITNIEKDETDILGQ